MSHFPVIVALQNPRDVHEALHEALAPFDENKEVAPYRDYETGSPAEHWTYSVLQRAAQNYKNGTGIKLYDPSGSVWSSVSSRKTADEQMAEIEKKAKLFSELSDPPSWYELYSASLKMYGDDNEYHYDGQTERLYTMSTYNPLSKWDWYQVGGRWTGYFRIKRGADRSKLIFGEPGIMTAPNRDVMRCDGGLKGSLDLDAMRGAAAVEAGEQYDAYHQLVADLPEAKPWSYFCGVVDSEDGYTIEDARRDYKSQPRIIRVIDTEFGAFMGPDPVEEYGGSREDFLQRTRDAAVPGYALLTHFGKWMAPGDMGWFGVSSDDANDRATYVQAANGYLDMLTDDTWLITVDCHI